MADRLRWGILGTGNIARQFAEGVTMATRSSVTAVGSRSDETARSFAEKFQIVGVHDSYDALLRDPNVDAVYNSLPNNLHHEWTIKALRAGKHVLCEKPFSMDAAEGEEMFDVAKKQGRVLIEAFMYRAHPLTHAVRDSIASGDIGDLRVIRTSFCYRTQRIAGNIRFDRNLAGGALMDVGCYCLNFSRLFAGAAPSSIQAVAHMHETGVDDYCAGSIKFDNGILATFVCGMTVQADNTAYLCGSEGFIEIPMPWKPPAEKATFSIVRATPPRQDLAAMSKSQVTPPPPRQTHTVDAGMPLYGLEADDFASTVFDGQPPMVSAEDTQENMRALDEIRRQIGLRF